MVRTKADAGKKAGGKAPRKAAILKGESSGSAKASGSKSDKYAGGNPYCPRPTPKWQKPITTFFPKSPAAKGACDSSMDALKNSDEMEKEPDDVGDTVACSSTDEVPSVGLSTSESEESENCPEEQPCDSEAIPSTIEETQSGSEDDTDEDPGSEEHVSSVGESTASV